MSDQNIFELAKQGNPNAVAALINRNLNPKGVTAKVVRRNDCLRIMLEAGEVPNQASAVRYIHSGITKLEVNGITTLQVFGRQVGDEVPAWSQTIDLEVQQLPQVAKQQSLKQSQPSKFTTPQVLRPKVANRVFAIVFGLMGLLGSLFILIIPVIGWILGIFGVFGSLGSIVIGLSGRGLLQGSCPYCNTQASVADGEAGFDCQGCNKRILIKDRKFYQVE